MAPIPSTPVPTLLMLANGASNSLLGPFPSAESAARVAASLPAGVVALAVPVTAADTVDG